MDIDIVSAAFGAVVSQAGGDVTGLATAPVRALSKHWEARITDRLQRHIQGVIAFSDGRPIVAPDRVRVKAAVEAALTDDEITHHYLAAVSAFPIADDRGVAIVAQIGRLSSIDLRLHFVVYRELHRILNGQPPPMVADINSDLDVGRHLEMYIPLSELVPALGVAEGSEGVLVIQAAFRNLARELLIAQSGGHGMNAGPQPEGFMVASQDRLAEYAGKRPIPAAGAVLRPSVSGMVLTAWATGEGDPTPVGFRTSSALNRMQGDISSCGSAVLTSSLGHL